MAYKKMVESRYALFGGINTKISQYLNGPMEFLALENVDFQTPGSLTERWGSTQYFGASLSGKVNGLYEFTQTSGASYFYVIAGGTLGLGLNGGFSSIYYGSDGTTAYSFFSGGSEDLGFSLAPLDFDFDTLQNQAFFASQNIFLKSAGVSVFFFGLPDFRPLGSTMPIAVSGTSVATGFTGVYYYQAAWVNSYGMAGRPTRVTTTNDAGDLLLTPFNIFPAVTAGATSILISARGLTRIMVPNTDITGIAFFRSVAQSSTVAITAINSLPYNLAGIAGLSTASIGVTFIDKDPTAGITLMNANTLAWNWYPFSAFSYETEALVGVGTTLVPKFIETHDNRLFIAGMSTSLSTFFFSEFGEPEHFEADFGFEVRINDGSGITGLKEYNGNLMIFKTKSFHQLSTAADDFANWVLTPVSTEYGCLSNRAVTTYANMLVFLDTKGVIRYNGSNIEILSTKIDPIFQRMNVSAAQTQAQMTYDKQRNEILCDIPVDGATMNNLTVVYDIIANAWTTYSGYRPAITTIAQGQLTNKQVFYGGYSGLISYFGSSFTADGGAAFTTIIKSGFLTDLGNSTQKVFRRLWLDTSPLGASAFIDVHFYQDYGASIIVGTTMPLTPFQNRIDFGVSAKSLSVEFIKNSTFRLALHGFSIAYRFQRNV